MGSQSVEEILKGSLNTTSSYCQECTGPCLTATSSGGISGSPVAAHGCNLR